MTVRLQDACPDSARAARPRFFVNIAIEIRTAKELTCYVVAAWVERIKTGVLVPPVSARELRCGSQDVKNVSLMRTCGKPVLVVLAVLVALSEAAAQEPASLENGYRLMYGLDFRSAEQVFQEWQREHPRDPFGPMSAASNLLFEELNRMGILQAQFFVDDTSFTARSALAPDPQLRGRFEAALADAEALARPILSADPHDHDALFALAMVYGLRADYAALIEGHNIAFLSNARTAATLAQTLLKLAPDYADAHRTLSSRARFGAWTAAVVDRHAVGVPDSSAAAAGPRVGPAQRGVGRRLVIHAPRPPNADVSLGYSRLSSLRLWLLAGSADASRDCRESPSRAREGWLRSSRASPPPRDGAGVWRRGTVARNAARAESR